MKKKWFRALELANEEYLTEAAPGQDNARKKKHPAFKAILASAACLALVLGSIWLFRPYSTVPPSVAKYESSEYYPVIEKLSALTWEKPRYKNNFDMLVANVTGIFKAASNGDVMAENNAPGDGDIYDGFSDVQENVGSAVPDGATGSENAGDDMQITDNQVAGISEGDRIKRTDKYIFYLDENTLRVYSIEGLESRELNRITLLSDTKNYYVNQWELYLSPDGNTVTVMAMYGRTRPGCA